MPQSAKSSPCGARGTRKVATARPYFRRTRIFVRSSAAVKKNAAAAVAKMAEVLRAQLNEGMNALGVVEAEALQSLAM